MKGNALLALNPEFQRLLWLEFSPNRLLLMPVLLTLVLGGVDLAEGQERVAPFADAAMFVMLILWGTRLAVESVAEEMTAQTWDVQRLSAINPWGIALGKLLGGAAYAWYGALFCIIVDLVLAPDRVGSDVPYIIAGGFVSQAASVFASLALFRTGRRGRRPAAQAQVVGVLIGIVVADPTFFHYSPLNLVPNFVAHPQAQIVNLLIWYGISMPVLTFRLLVCLSLGIWFFVGAAALIRHDMGERRGPLAWTLFIVYACVLMIGLDAVNMRLPVLLPLQVGALAALATYLALGLSPLTRTDWKRLQFAARREGWRGIWRELPTWIPSATITVGAGGVLMFTSIIYAIQPGDMKLIDIGPAVVFGYLGNFIRDLLFICAIRIAFQRRTGLLLVVVFVMLYVFFPYVLMRIHQPMLRDIFLPSSDSELLGIVGPWVLAAAALALLLWAVRGATATRSRA